MENYDSLDRIFHALSDPTRRQIVQRLILGPASVKQLASAFSMGLPAFMKHLRVLEGAGLISSRKAGRVRTCHVRPRQLGVAEQWLGSQRSAWHARPDRLTVYGVSHTPHR